MVRSELLQHVQNWGSALREPSLECLSPLHWAPRLTLFFTSLKRGERCPPLILIYKVSDVVTVILLCFQIPNYVETISENEGTEETINNTISGKSNIT